MKEGSLYHIYNRGNNKQSIFFEERNYHYFLKTFNEYLSPFVDVYAYCLMPNHFHFLIRVKETSEVYKTSEVLQAKLTPIEKAFKNFFISYAKSINKVYDRTGSLFQAKFKKKEITNEAYFTAIIQYIHENPLKADLCANFDEYKFSSYRGIAYGGNTKIKRADVLAWFGGTEQFIKTHQTRKLKAEKMKLFLF